MQYCFSFKTVHATRKVQINLKNLLFEFFVSVFSRIFTETAFQDNYFSFEQIGLVLSYLGSRELSYRHEERDESENRGVRTKGYIY